MKRLLSGILFPLILFSFGPPVAGQIAASDSLDDQLVTAVKNADTAAVQKLLNQGANIEAMSGDGATRDQAAAPDGDHESVEIGDFTK